MANAMSITNAAADAMLTAFGALCNGGQLKIYDGTMPTDVNAALSSNNVLAILTMANPAFTTSGTSGNNRTYAVTSVTGDSSADATGTATFFRVFTSGATVVWQGTVGTSASDMIIDSTSIIAGGAVNVSALSVALPTK